MADIKSGMKDQNTGKIDPRAGAAKKLTPPMPHPSMTRRQTNTMGIGGLSHNFPGAPDASGPTPVDPTCYGGDGLPPKPFLGKLAPTVIGHRSRSGSNLDAHELSEAILAEGHAASAPDDRMAAGRGPDGTRLPDSTTDNSAPPVRKP